MKIMEIIEKETKGKSYHTYKYSYDSIGLPSIDYDDDPNKVMKWKDSGETGSPKKPIDLKPLADQLQNLNGLIPFARSTTSLGKAHIIAKHIICTECNLVHLCPPCGGMMLS